MNHHSRRKRADIAEGADGSCAALGERKIGANEEAPSRVALAVTGPKPLEDFQSGFVGDARRQLGQSRIGS